MSAIALCGLAAIAAGLMLLGLAAAFRPRLAIPAAGGLCALGAVLALADLLVGAPPVLLILPVGPLGAATLALDGLSAFFLLLLLLAGTALAAASLDDPPATPPLVGLGAIALALLAGDSFTLVLGTALAVFAVRPAAAPAVAVLLAAALALLAPDSWDFAALRTHPPDSWRALALLALLLPALAPLLLPPARPASGPAAVLGAALLPPLAIYVLVRLLLDLAGPAPAPWWGLPLLLLGAAGAALASHRANAANEMQPLLAAAAAAGAGLVITALGVALAARAADLAPLAALALGAALVLTLAQALVLTLLHLAAGAVRLGAGTQALDRLGGLLRSMPITSAAVLLGGLGLAALPPGPGFAGWWLLFQAVLGAARLGGVALQSLVCGVVALLALAMALLAAATLRLIGVGFLGRPRTPRAAAAEEAAPPTSAALAGLAALATLAGLFPGAVLALAAPALRRAAGADLADRASWLAVLPNTDAQGYPALAVVLLLALSAAAVLFVLRRHAVRGHRAAPAWDGGQPPPPAWLPFGDPLTQLGAAGFAPALRRLLAPPLPPDTLSPPLALAAWAERLHNPATGFAALFAVLLLMLLALAIRS